MQTFGISQNGLCKPLEKGKRKKEKGKRKKEKGEKKSDFKNFFSKKLKKKILK